MRDELTRKRRADAEDNRRHLVAVAHTAFARHGPDLPVREIARRAGLAPATVHRHFPSRDDLLAAVLAGQVERCEGQLRAALADPDSRRALTRTFHRFGEWRVEEPGLMGVLEGPEFADRRRAPAEAVARRGRRGRAGGGGGPACLMAPRPAAPRGGGGGAAGPPPTAYENLNPMPIFG